MGTKECNRSPGYSYHLARADFDSLPSLFWGYSSFALSNEGDAVMENEHVHIEVDPRPPHASILLHP